MNINPNVKRILCYGDSNTWGQIPITKERYPANVRWTGLLQEKLGDSFEIIEEGLSSRTTQWEYSEKEGRNGKTYLVPCLESQNPVDCVILFLGTNDTKEIYNQTPIQIASSIRELVQLIRQKAWTGEKKAPQIVIISPAIVNQSVPSTQERYNGAQQKSQGLAKEYEKVALEEECTYIDLASTVQPSKQDGLHFDSKEHSTIAQLIEVKIREMFQ